MTNEYGKYVVELGELEKHANNMLRIYVMNLWYACSVSTLYAISCQFNTSSPLWFLNFEGMNWLFWIKIIVWLVSHLIFKCGLRKYALCMPWSLISKWENACFFSSNICYCSSQFRCVVNLDVKVIVWKNQTKLVKVMV